MLFKKYMPKKLNEIIGHEEAKEKIKVWLLNWFRGVKQKPILIFGPPGVGKTSLAYALANEYNLELIEMSSSDVRDSKNVERVLENASLNKSLSDRKKIILIDDIDAISSEDKGGINTIKNIIKESHYPVLLTAIDPWEKKISPIREASELVELKKLTQSAIFSILKLIVEKENIEVEESILIQIAKNADGDVRAALNDLEAKNISVRDKEKDIFAILRSLFYSQTYAKAREVAFYDIDHDLLKAWIEENIPYEYSLKIEIAKSFNNLSLGDIFDGRISKRQYWGFLRYSNDFITAGVALSRVDRTFKFVNYKFPSFIKQLSLLSTIRNLKKEIGRKIALKIHTNKKEALEILPLIKHFLLKNILVSKYYDLNEEEISLILNESVASVREKLSAAENNLETKKVKKSKEKSSKKNSEDSTSISNLNNYF